MRGTAVGPTVNDLYNTLVMLREHGFGESKVRYWEPYNDDWTDIGYLTYNQEEVRIYSE